MATEVEQPVSETKGITPLGPYRATKLWNDVIRAFRVGLPVRRHRRYMKSYDKCFVASDAITWLHDYLRSNPNFGPTVSRIQTLQLMQKFHKARLFEDVRGVKHAKSELSDGNKLYRFVSETTPVKPARVPLAPCNSLMNNNTTGPSDSSTKPDKIKMAEIHKPEPDPIPSSCHLVAKTQVTPEEIEEVWKAQTLQSLQLILRLDSLNDIVDPAFVSASYIIHNMTQVNKNGIVSNIDKNDNLPHWVISAMRCLAYWPSKVESNLPDYPGFEKDVFKAVKKYFESLLEPLTSFAMYEMFISVMAHLDNIQRPRHSFGSVSSAETSKNMTSYASVENLMANMTLNARMLGDMDLRPSEIMIVHDPDHDASRHDRQPSQRSRSQVNIRRTMSSASVLNSRKVETYFGTENNTAHTRYYETDQGEWMPDSDNEVFERESGRQSSLSHHSRGPVKGRRGSYGDVYGKSVNRTVCSSSLSNRHSVHTPYKDDAEKYGYTVVLSTAPRVEVEAPGMPWRATPTYRQSRRTSQRDRYNWAGSCGNLAPTTSSKKQEVHNPPPYIPPPSYNSYCSQKSLPRASTFRARCEASSCSSYHTASTDSPSERGHSVSSLDFCSTQSVPALMRNLPVNDSYMSHCSLKRTKSKASLTESYRLAIDGNVTTGTQACTPVGRSLYGTLKRCESSPGLFHPSGHDRVLDALQICCLLLPPGSRRKLHLLLRLMHKMAANEQLVIDESVSTRELVLQTFTRCILRSQDEADYDDYLTQRAVTLMMDNYVEVLKVPEKLKVHIEGKVDELKKSRIRFVWDDQTSNLTYCEQVSQQEYENQKLSVSQKALADLLEGIVNDRASSQKDKKRRLKQFQKNYPDIYSHRFPTSRSDSNLLLKKPKMKPALLSRPLHKLRSLRV